MRRDTTVLAGAATGSDSTGGNPSVVSAIDNSGFGAGASAGIGGQSRSAGIGNFDINQENDRFQPFGAFAGLNFGRGDRLGAGCNGLNCGVQLGDLALSTRQMLNGAFSQARKELEARSYNVTEGLETSETFLTGVTLRERVDSVRGFITDIFRGLQDTLTSLFRGASSGISGLTGLGGAANPPVPTSPTESVATPSSSASNQTYYRIQLGSPSKAIAVTLPSVVDISENDLFKKTT